MRRRNSDARLRELERAVAASPDDLGLSERLLAERVRHGLATIEEVMLFEARQRPGASVFSRVFLPQLRVALPEIVRARNTLYERDLVDLRGALVDPRLAGEHRVMFVMDGWVVTTHRDFRRERSGWLDGPRGGGSWVAYDNDTLGFDRRPPVRVRNALSGFVRQFAGEPRTVPWPGSLMPTCHGCTTMHGTDVAIRHPDWYECPNTPLVQARDEAIDRMVATLSALRWPGLVPVYSSGGKQVGWADEETLDGYRGERDERADFGLRQMWLLRQAERLPIRGLLSGSAWNERLAANWRAHLARLAVERVMEDGP